MLQHLRIIMALTYATDFVPQSVNCLVNITCSDSCSVAGKVEQLSFMKA